jgi:hypothetical protein
MLYHPVEGTVEGRHIGLSRGEVGNEKDVGSGSRAHRLGVESIARKGRGEDTVIDVQLSSSAGVLSNLLAHPSRVIAIVPIEIEGDEDFHAIASSRLVSIVELLIRVVVDANIEGKGVNASVMGSAHVIIVVGSASTIANNSDLMT